MAKGFSLADQLFNMDTVAQLADGFGRAGIFDPAAFHADVMADLQSHELKGRIAFIADVLERYLPSDFSQAAAAIERALPPPLDPTLTDDDFGHFIYAPLGVYVENHALNDHLSSGMMLLKELTKRFSMEFSIRAFLNHDQDAAMEYVTAWAGDENYHVRRLASEGTRPRLPWGHNVGLTSSETLKILDQLYRDPTRFVTRSVGNHLNDITKTEPDAVLDRLEAWQKTDHQSDKELGWMRRHALRGLIKAGHPRAMVHLGCRPDLPLATSEITCPAQIRMGQKVTIVAEITPMDAGPIMIDYVIDFVKFNGKTAPKTFNFKALTGKADVPIQINKTHHFDPTATTFRIYPGPHRIHLQVNGRIVASQDFDLC
jgi:3-methyladenine DNA glycosylase AlkC